MYKLKLIYDDPDCKKLAPSSKEIGTIKTDKITIIGSCELLVVHPDTSSLKQVTFHVTSHEGSVVLSCETSLVLHLIQPCSNLDQIPGSATLICSNADHPMKRKSKKSVQVSKQNQSMCTRKEEISTKSVSQEKYVNQCVIQEVQEERSLWECLTNVMDDKNCQSNVCSDKNCQEALNVYMQPMKSTKKISNYMWLPKPAIQCSYQISLCSDKNCQPTRCYKKKCPMRPVCDDKNCKSAKCAHMQQHQCYNLRTRRVVLRTFK